MSCNIVNEYVDFSRKSIKKYVKTILERYYDQDIFDDLINAYINTRYYDMYDRVDKRFKVNIVYYLKKSLENIKNDEAYKNKAKYMFQTFKYILYFDSVIECDSVRPLIHEIYEYRSKLELIDEDFESKIYNMLKDDLLAKQNFINSFNDKNFSIDYVKVEKQIFDCNLVHNIKFSKIYSDYAINKVFNSKEIGEQKLFVTYSLLGCKVLQDIIKGNFTKKYLVDYEISLKNKPKKKKLLNIIDNDIVKEKVFLKISFADFIQNKEEVYSLTKAGFKIAIILDDSFALEYENIMLLKVFAYVITDDYYDELKGMYNTLYIPSKGD